MIWIFLYFVSDRWRVVYKTRAYLTVSFEYDGFLMKDSGWYAKLATGIAYYFVAKQWKSKQKISTNLLFLATMCGCLMSISVPVWICNLTHEGRKNCKYAHCRSCINYLLSCSRRSGTDAILQNMGLSGMHTAHFNDFHFIFFRCVSFKSSKFAIYDNFLRTAENGLWEK